MKLGASQGRRRDMSWGRRGGFAAEWIRVFGDEIYMVYPWSKGFTAYCFVTVIPPWLAMKENPGSREKRRGSSGSVIVIRRLKGLESEANT